MSEIKIYGFDYDYTLANYKPTVDYLLYNQSRQFLLEKFRYPKDIGKYEYIPNFAILGLHYDIEKGLLLKLDSFFQIEFGSVYRGLTQLSDEEVLTIYKNRTLPIAFVEGFSKMQKHIKPKLIQLADLFSVPGICLLVQVIEHFQRNNIDYHPEILFDDVKKCIDMAHPIMREKVVENIHEYVDDNPDLRVYFEILRNGGKKLFLITNSPFHLVNTGMKMLIGDDWRDFFDIIIIRARKPSFFTDSTCPIRIFDEKSDTHSWEKVTKLEKGVIYFEGTVKQLQELTGWRGGQVLFFGDHPFVDLQDATLEHGWKTGAIIEEMHHEIETINTTSYKTNTNWLLMLTQMIEDNQDQSSPEAKQALRKWIAERDELRQLTKEVFNKQFGSVFRTNHNPSYFSRRLFRFADIYTSKLTNMKEYSLDHTFYPRRRHMPHESSSYFL